MMLSALSLIVIAAESAASSLGPAFIPVQDQSVIPILEKASPLINWEKPVLMQVMYSDEHVPSLHLSPSTLDAGESGDRSTWHLVGTMQKSGAVDLVITGLNCSTPTNANLSKAVVVAAKHLKSRGVLQVPTVVKATRAQRGFYFVSFTMVPLTPDAFQAVKVSGNFKSSEIIGPTTPRNPRNKP